MQNYAVELRGYPAVPRHSFAHRFAYIFDHIFFKNNEFQKYLSARRNIFDLTQNSVKAVLTVLLFKTHFAEFCVKSVCKTEPWNCSVNFLQKTVFQGNTVKYGEILSHRKIEQQRNRESPSRRMTSASFAQSCLNMTMETGRRAPTYPLRISQLFKLNVRLKYWNTVEIQWNTVEIRFFAKNSVCSRNPQNRPRAKQFFCNNLVKFYRICMRPILCSSAWKYASLQYA